jgi:hypothetical protein
VGLDGEVPRFYDFRNGPPVEGMEEPNPVVEEFNADERLSL